MGFGRDGRGNLSESEFIAVCGTILDFAVAVRSNPGAAEMAAFFRRTTHDPSAEEFAGFLRFLATPQFRPNGPEPPAITVGALVTVAGLDLEVVAELGSGSYASVWRCTVRDKGNAADRDGPPRALALKDLTSPDPWDSNMNRLSLERCKNMVSRLDSLVEDLVDSVSRKKEAEGAAPGRRQKASSGDHVTQNTKKEKVAPPKK